MLRTLAFCLLCVLFIVPVAAGLIYLPQMRSKPLSLFLQALVYLAMLVWSGVAVLFARHWADIGAAGSLAISAAGLWLGWLICRRAAIFQKEPQREPEKPAGAEPAPETDRHSRRHRR